jgi:hypothetical protein
MKTGENPYAVELHEVNKYRGLAFLICENDKDVDAKSVFGNLKPKADRQVRTGFDTWLIDKPNKKRFHGWDDSKRHDCFVFKWKEGQQGHRLYGFLYNPLPKYPNFQLCVLVLHATKNRWKTEPRSLNKVNELKANGLVKKAIVEATKNLKLDEIT